MISKSLAGRLAFGICVGATFWPAVAKADEVAACVKASEKAQTLKDESKYRLAREQLLICTRDVCPGIVKKDCAQWLIEVDNAMPSVVISAKDGKGQDLTAVKVTLDGQPLIEVLDGKSQPLDPGAHTFRYEQAGSAPIEEKVVLGTGEKNRVIKVQFPNADGSFGSGSGSIENPSGDTAKKPPIAAFIIGGIGVVALGSFAFFGLTGTSDISDLRDGPNKCAPNCDPSKVDAAKTKLLVGDISLGIGVVAIGVATYMLLTHKSAEATVTAASASPTRPLQNAAFLSTPTFDVKSLPGGGYASVGARF